MSHQSKECKIIKDFFSSDTLHGLESFINPKTKCAHIIYAMSEGADSLQNLISNFSRAISILQKNMESTSWLNSLKPRLLENDMKNVKATIGEIIAYAELINAEYTVIPQPTGKAPSPEFIVKDSENNEFVVEVFSKQMCEEATNRIGSSQKNIEQASSENCSKVFTDIQVIRPYGYSDDSVAEDAISKITAIKGGEHQSSLNKPFIVWVDIQNSSDFILGNPDFAEAITSWNGRITSGHFWYGLYGKKGLSIFNNYGIYDTLGEREFYQMKHDGRYLKSKTISGVFFKFEKAVIFFENPTATNKISNATRAQLTKIYGFDFGKSLIDFAENLVQEKVDTLYKEIEALAQ